MNIDDPTPFTEPTYEELLRINRALRLRLDLSVEAMRHAAYTLNSVAFDVTDAEQRAEIGSAYADTIAVVQVATGQSADIPKRLARQMSLARRDEAKRLLTVAA